MIHDAISVVAIALLAIGLFYLTACIVLYAVQCRLVFVPTAEIETTPTDLGLDYETVTLPIASPSNEPQWIRGWWIPSDCPDAPTVLQLHGNGLNRGANVWQSARLHRMGLSVFAIDYRGYGDSSGPFPTETRVYEDAERAWQYLTQERQIPPNQIVLYGHSLGGAIAIELATCHPEVAGLIVQSSFTSMREMTACATVYDRLFPIDWILNQHFNSMAKVRSLKPPVLYIHGTADYLIPPRLSEALHAATRSDSQLVLIEDADHNNVGEVAGDRYFEIVVPWLQTLYPQAQLSIANR
jgi:pimeloyl-ACP methyl ester carboxylesterase